jgi:hypothetical protein
MSSVLERKIQGPAPMALPFILGEKLAVSREWDKGRHGYMVFVVDDDPVMRSRRAQTCAMACGGGRRSCLEASAPLERPRPRS